MSRLVSDSVPVHLHHWLSAAPDSLLSVTELSELPLHVSGTVHQIFSLPHLPWQSCGPGLKLTCLTFPTPVIAQCLRRDSSCFRHYNRSCLLTRMSYGSGSRCLGLHLCLSFIFIIWCWHQVDNIFSFLMFIRMALSSKQWRTQSNSSCLILWPRSRSQPHNCLPLSFVVLGPW